MAELSSINVDADGIPNAAGTDTVPTLKILKDIITTGHLGVRLDSATVNANGRASEEFSGPMALDLEAFTSLQAIETATESAVTGASIFRHLDLDETKREVKGSAGTVLWGAISSLQDGAVSIKFYNAPAASVTVGTTTPVMTIEVPKRVAADDPVAYPLEFPACGIAFSSGITVACTTERADSGTTGPSANAVLINLAYK